ncbi:hypothetical protein KJ819_03475 [Patescibacteria group bacterium]|nr:hypothetical protein [Patescibacteria group bacterium]MBU1500529.1 hypothetical protein [Patescibacteria group bacterium]MBU2080418.1 hypothetical protein [Patescibacteria group bacterium]MBU2123777.1 hypothetical protein [Patescibacteria group bacterium]MBU2194633.1 hypothetical protein [Patescibacteria group bacterium]
MWLTYDPYWNAIYLASTYYFPAFVLAVFFFLLVLFTPRAARRKAFKVALSLFVIVLVISGVLFVAGIVLFLGFVLAPQAMMFLSAFLPTSAIALLLARFLKREPESSEVPVRMGALPLVYAIGSTLALTVLAVGAIYASVASKPKVALPNLDELRGVLTLNSTSELPASFLDFVRTTEEFKTELRKEEERYFSFGRKPFMHTTSDGTQVLISSTQELKQFAPEKYKEFVEDYTLRSLTTHEMYMPERLRAELPRFRQEERVVHAESNTKEIEPLLRSLAALGLPSDLTSIQVADSLIRFAPQNSYRVDEVAHFVRGYTMCQSRKYFFLFAPCLYESADGTVYRIVEE